ncbi:Ferredoxin 7Fe [bacterium HR40]|nr:Ferredoxin 7Fe [bacterium HR40]
MSVDVRAIASALGASAVEEPFDQLCRAQIAHFQRALASGEPLLVACEQEAAVFDEVAQAAGFGSALRFVDLRDRAGWSDEGEGAAAKMAALLAEALLEGEPAPSVSLSSGGEIVVYGRGELALEAARRLADRLAPRVLLREAGDIIPPRAWNVPVFRGRIRQARGWLGRFELEVEDFAAARPSSRAALVFGEPVPQSQLTCDLILDLSGETPLFPAPAKRDGYLWVDPADPLAVERALFQLTDMVGEFEKPRYVTYDEGVCVHMRSRIVGCTRCLDVCPTGAITSGEDRVVIEPHVCAGCGSCSGVCPTAAVSYASPAPSFLLERLRTLLLTFLRAGGAAPDLLLYEDRHGGEMLSLWARLGRGLPARTLPFRLPEIGLIGIELLASAFAWGARRVMVLAPPSKRAELPGLEQNVQVVQEVLDGLGYGRERLLLLFEDDPEVVDGLLRAPFDGPSLAPATHAALGTKRQLARLAFDHLHAQAANPVEAIPLPPGAPYGTVVVDTEGCTLCLSCVGACPTGALLDNPDRPMLRFDEALCVQCGLCRNTCPEKVIRLEPRLAFGALVAGPRLVKEEEPFSCIRCGKPFGVKSSIDRILAKLAGSHWMYRSERQIAWLQMCADCRVVAQFEAEDRPFVLGTPRKPRTTEDYLREREEGEAIRRQPRADGKPGGEGPAGRS